ncbi:MAG: uroporphyrin-III C-methyltransferase/precorrin-2 dehydrogenase/sirohydrochlorin ferrochelatase [Gammaproteobacteria bacterium]|jgi:uroporphyrin-III C-methyltransferase/precorrin-2 dehydrogenase/sirohydrochlorin ferrochelatase
MRYFPVFVDLRDQRVVFSGAGRTAVAKLRLLLKSEARIEVFASEAAVEVQRWHAGGTLSWQPRALCAADLLGATLVYAASGESAEDQRVADLARTAGVLCNVVDNLQASRFLTPAIVDRDPVTVAICTEGTAPVLARQIKADIEDALAVNLGSLARAAARLRERVARYPRGAWRRRFWRAFFAADSKRSLTVGTAVGDDASEVAIGALLERHARGHVEPGRIALVGAGPGDPELLTLGARRVLRDADVVLYDRLVDPRILELARREAHFEEVGKSPAFRPGPTGRSWTQGDINARCIEHARNGHRVVRLKSGDPLIFGRADEELDAFEAAGFECEIVPGITAAVAASASLRSSLTRRGRNSEVRLVSAHDVDGYAEQDWRAMAAPGAVTALYMGVRAARFVQGRLMLFGAEPHMPVSIVENASREDERVLCGQLCELDALFRQHQVKGPAVIFTGLAARANVSTLHTQRAVALASGATAGAIPGASLTAAQ